MNTNPWLTLLDEVSDTPSPAHQFLRLGLLRQAAAALAQDELDEGTWAGAAPAHAPLVRLAADSGAPAPWVAQADIPGAAPWRVEVRLDPTGPGAWVAQVRRVGGEGEAPAAQVRLSGADGIALDVELAPGDETLETWLSFELGEAPSLSVGGLGPG